MIVLKKNKLLQFLFFGSKIIKIYFKNNKNNRRNLTQAHCVRFTSGHARHLYMSKLIMSDWLKIALS